jgi:hypothetical protein
MGRCQLLQMLAVLGALASQTNVNRAHATEQQVAQAAPSQTTPAEPAKKVDDVPPGGCTPIGLTASGEMVFPLLCRTFLEQQRGPIAQELPASTPKPDAPVTVSKQDTPTADAKQDSAPPPAKQEVATTPPDLAAPTTTSAIARSDSATQIVTTMGKPVAAAKESKRDLRRKRLAGRRGGANAPPGPETTGSIER